MSNLAIEQNFATEQGNQLIVDTLPAVECIQGGIGADEESSPACVQIYLGRKKIIPTKKKKKSTEQTTATSKPNKKWKGHPIVISPAFSSK